MGVLVVPGVSAIGEAAAGPSPRAAEGKRSRSSKRVRVASRGRATRKKGKKYRKRKICTWRKGKRRCRWRATFEGHGVSRAKLRTEPLPRPSGDLHVYAVNFREELRVNLYGEDGGFDPEALAALDRVFRCRRSKTERAMDPKLYEVLSIIYDHFGQRRVEIVSGFRLQPDQETSRHFHASAMDVRIPGVSTRTLYEYATSLDPGGMGIGKYPNSEFVHIDFRAPGEKSFRWTDYSPPKNKQRRGRKSRRTRPNT